MKTHTTTAQRPGREHGIALITVIMLLLILTALGITASILMTQEDRTASRQDFQRSALYAAEAGLRRAEANLKLLDATNSSNINALLQHTPVAIQVWTTLALPTQPSLGQPNTWTVDHLGTYMVTVDPGTKGPTGVELVDQQVVYTGGAGAASAAAAAFYTLYVRNNPESPPGTSVTNDTDNTVRLISVGYLRGVVAPKQVLDVKILEEEFHWSGVSQSPGVQKQANQGGTGSILTSGIQ
ncbi:MAG: PilX N-terminal domain-containing pilus assembly protein [Thermoanaerobaculales bacterium]